MRREHGIDRRNPGTAIDDVERGIERAGGDRDAVFVLVRNSHAA